MVTAEKWYEYEDNYIKHGLDFEPMRERRAAAQSKAKAQAQSQAKAKMASSVAKDKARAMTYVVLLAVVGIGLVISSAYAASLKCEINSIIAENTEIEREIETLNVQIKTANNISAIETRAMEELGMIYPTSDEIVYVLQAEAPATEFAMIVKDQAYN